MKRFQKVLFTLTAVIALGWVGASTASAQVQFFVSASGARRLRSESKTDAVGTVSFAANSTGTIKVNSTITLDYGTAVLSTSGTVVTTCTVGSFLKSVDTTNAPNVLKLTVDPAGADLACAAGQSINVTAARVDGNALGAGATVDVDVTASVPAAFQSTNAITLIQVGALVVGTVQAAPSTKVSFKFIDPFSGTILLCDIPSATTNLELDVTVEEKFADAFLSKKDETDLNNTGTVKDMKVRFSFKSIPIGVRINANPDTTASAGTLGTLTTSLTANFDSVSGTQDVDVDVTLDDADAGTATAAVEKLIVKFFFSVPDKAKLTTSEATGTLAVALRGSTTAGEVPVFASNTQLSDNAVLTRRCDCYLLFSWLPYTGDGAFDSGIAINNTTKDPPTIGTKGQTGDVDVYFWKTDGTSPSASPVKLATALGPGETKASTVSAMLGAPFLGYAIARAQFQLCHGFAFITNPQPGTGGAFAQGYLPLVINNPRLKAINPTITESAGH